MSFLKNIIDCKLKEVEDRSVFIPLDKLKESQRLYKIRDFKKSLVGNRVQIISEFKRYSPSNNNIKLDASLKDVVLDYVNNGASSISILTDGTFFGGDIGYIRQAKELVDVPILRKDFIISSYQVWESYYLGADAILLIADILDYEDLCSLYGLATQLGLGVLVEFHSIESIEKVKILSPKIIGVNCRNLDTMKVDFNWFEKVVDLLPDKTIKVAESGICSHEHLEKISKLGYSAALIGTALMRGGNPGESLAALLGADFS